MTDIVKKKLSRNEIKKLATQKRKLDIIKGFGSVIFKTDMKPRKSANLEEEVSIEFDNDQGLRRKGNFVIPINQKISFAEQIPKRRKRNPWTEVEVNLLDIAMDEVPEGQP